MDNLLLITDVARLRTVFGYLADDKMVKLRIANNLEKGAEEIALEMPDVVFVQTHLSGLSAEILLMHLKKQLGSKQSRFVLLAADNQINETILALYQNWLNTSSEDDILLSDLRALLESLTTKTKQSPVTAGTEISVVDLPKLHSTETALTPVTQTQDNSNTFTVLEETIPEPVAEAIIENSLEEQGITYSPRHNISVYSEFNSSFDTAVNSAPEPTHMKNPALESGHWNDIPIETEDFPHKKSKKLTFLMWLAPVVIAVTIATMLQHRDSSKTAPVNGSSAKPVDFPVTSKTATLNSFSSAKSMKPVMNSITAAKKATSKVTIATTDPAVQSSDKSVIGAIAENSVSNKKADPAFITVPRPTEIPGFIPTAGVDNTYTAKNPGWERYTSQDVDFRVYREQNYIKAIQVIALNGISISKPFLNNVLKQLMKNPVFVLETSEVKESYKIERGHLAKNLTVAFYRDEQGGKLRAFVITWK